MADTPTYESAGGADGGILERRLTNPAGQEVPHPGDVRINVKGAFIVDGDEEVGTPGEDFDENGYQHDRKDIRLPNHKAVVSHIAVDVRRLVFPPLSLTLCLSSLSLPNPLFRNKWLNSR